MVSKFNRLTESYITALPKQQIHIKKFKRDKISSKDISKKNILNCKLAIFN